MASAINFVYRAASLEIANQASNEQAIREALREAMPALIECGANEISLSHVPHNEKTGQFYQSVGFEYNGEKDGEELVMIYNVNQDNK